MFEITDPLVSTIVSKPYPFLWKGVSHGDLTTTAKLVRYLGRANIYWKCW